jgi:hypothetical protein
MKQLDTPAGCFASKSKILQCGVIAHHADRQQGINQLHNAESQMERKMTLIRPARFSWVTELVLTSRRRGQLWLSAVNFSAIQSHRAFHSDLWPATGPSTGYCPIWQLFVQVESPPLEISEH